ncbi:esterase/lipase family protein [Simplicispira lacusdiani]|uniref:esterase/lipase family protein n=1 Tax=Simplicispira lacusdiani TaxID=2213010 RepID=UPI000E74AC54|nr:alpha/beta hydrolase [Simplicispira lacusdiani]
MALPPPPKPGQAARAGMAAARQLRASDLRGAARLATQATAGVARIAEGVHQSVLGTLGLPGGAEAGRARGLTGMVYQGVQGVTRLVDAGLQAALLRLEPFLERAAGGADAAPPFEREAVLSALNGVMGDRLAADANPLAVPMELRQQGRPLDLAALRASGAATGKVLLLVHGLCMNDLQWQRAGHDHGAHLARALGYTPVYLRYNTGRHTSENGRLLAGHIEALLRDWPVPVQEFSMLAHSMGGLVARAACHYGAEAGQRWPAQLRRIVFLGTPHHGAPLERAGNWVDVLLGSTPYSRPFARLGQLRSAGITDLRHGHVLDADWQGRDRFRRSPDARTPVPLPSGVECFAVAATLAARRSPVAERLVGDGLVPLRSALGVHDDAVRGLAFAPSRQYVAHRTGHLELLCDPGVARQLAAWLAPPPAG